MKSVKKSPIVLEKPYNLEKIVKKRQNDDGEFEYLVRWEGYSSKYDTWEPYDHVKDFQKELEKLNFSELKQLKQKDMVSQNQKVMRSQSQRHQNKQKEKISPVKSVKKSNILGKRKNEGSQSGFYEIDKLIEKKEENGKKWYLVRWKGWDASHDSWEPYENVKFIPEAIKELEQQLKKRESGEKLNSNENKKNLIDDDDKKSNEEQETQIEEQDEDFVEQINQFDNIIIQQACQEKQTINKQLKTPEKKISKKLIDVIEIEDDNQTGQNMHLQYPIDPDQIVIKETNKNKKEKKIGQSDDTQEKYDINKEILLKNARNEFEQKNKLSELSSEKKSVSSKNLSQNAQILFNNIQNQPKQLRTIENKLNKELTPKELVLRAKEQYENFEESEESQYGIQSVKDLSQNSGSRIKQKENDKNYRFNEIVQKSQKLVQESESKPSKPKQPQQSQEQSKPVKQILSEKPFKQEQRPTPLEILKQQKILNQQKQSQHQQKQNNKKVEENTKIFQDDNLSNTKTILKKGQADNVRFSPDGSSEKSQPNYSNNKNKIYEQLIQHTIISQKEQKYHEQELKANQKKLKYQQLQQNMLQKNILKKIQKNQETQTNDVFIIDDENEFKLFIAKKKQIEAEKEIQRAQRKIDKIQNLKEIQNPSKIQIVDIENEPSLDFKQEKIITKYGSNIQNFQKYDQIIQPDLHKISIYDNQNYDYDNNIYLNSSSNNNNNNHVNNNHMNYNKMNYNHMNNNYINNNNINNNILNKNNMNNMNYDNINYDNINQNIYYDTINNQSNQQDDIQIQMDQYKQQRQINNENNKSEQNLLEVAQENWEDSIIDKFSKKKNISEYGSINQNIKIDQFENVIQKIEVFTSVSKDIRLLSILQQVPQNVAVLILCNNYKKIEMLHDKLEQEYTCVNIKQFQQNIQDFQNTQTLLIFGIQREFVKFSNFKNIKLLINYDFPEHSDQLQKTLEMIEDGQKKYAISFFTQENASLVFDISYWLKAQNLHIPEALVKLQQSKDIYDKEQICSESYKKIKKDELKFVFEYENKNKNLNNRNQLQDAFEFNSAKDSLPRQQYNRNDNNFNDFADRNQYWKSDQQNVQPFVNSIAFNETFQDRNITTAPKFNQKFMSAQQQENQKQFHSMRQNSANDKQFKYSLVQESVTVKEFNYN